MADVFRLLQAASRGLPVLEAVQRASQGDEEAMRYLKEQGWCDALDALIRPGAGAVAKQAVQMVKGYADGSVIEGEYREIGGFPWDGFISRLLNTDSGGHILLGAPGTGKTTLAIKLANRLADKLGYTAEWCNVYPSDVPDFGRVIHIDTVIDRMKTLQQYLKAQASTDEEDEEEDTLPDKKQKVAQPPPGRRIVVIDEAGLAMGNTATDAGRRAALQALAQSRHARWHVVFLAQWSGQLPLPLLGQCTLWVKKPRGDEKDTDRDNRVVRQLWEEAEAGFKGLQHSRYYAPPWDDVRSWAYVKCLTLQGKPGYVGMVPFTPYRMDSGQQESDS